MIIVADTSPIRYLVELEQVELLPRLFGAVLIPQAVSNELTDDDAPEKVRSFLQKTPDWLQICKPGPDISRVRQNLGLGEREAIAAACDMGADLLLIDDAAARREAFRLKLRVTGTLGVLQLAATNGWIDPRILVPRLVAAGFYVSNDVIESAFREWLG